MLQGSQFDEEHPFTEKIVEDLSNIRTTGSV